jgi:elongation factor G
MTLVLPISSFDPSDYPRAEPGLQGLVDLVNWKVWKCDGNDLATYPLPETPQDLQRLDFMSKDHPILPHLFESRTKMLDNLSMFSDELLEALLNRSSNVDAYLDISDSLIKRCLRQATLSTAIVPVLCGSALKHIGTELLLDYAGELLASPVDVSPAPQSRNAPLAMLAWKVTWDSKRGWMTFVRVYSGQLSLIPNSFC